MAKLNQIIAVEPSIKSQTQRDLTDAYHMLQKQTLLTGISRNYRPIDDEGDHYPPESTLVQTSVEEIIENVVTSLNSLFDVVATKEWANSEARADIIVDGEVLVEDVPVTYLLFLEKQLTDLHTFVKSLPTLDPSEKWVFDEAQAVWATEPAQTTKTKKIPRNHVKAEATPEHPAQVEVYYEDVVVGYWNTTKFSGALPASRIRDVMNNVRKLQEAVKFAREAANGTEVVQRRVGKKIMNFIFGVLTK